MKQNLKSIREEVRKEISKEYKQRYDIRIKQLEETIGSFNSELKETRNENFRLKNENEELREKNSKYEDWIERLQEWCNLPEDERQEAIKQYNIQKNTNLKLNGFIKIFEPYFKMMSLC